MRQTQKLRDLHADSIKEFNQVWEAQRAERDQALQDRRFYSIAGAMWEGQLGEQFENKPKVEVNKIHLSVIRLINEYRNNPITVDFVSKDGAENSDLADTCNMLYRADCQDSVAEEAFGNGFEEGVGGGMGAWRIRNCYEDEGDEDNEQQRIEIEPIVDADQCVFFDLDAKRQDKSDARRCWVLTGMTPESFKAEWGKEASSIDKRQTQFDWTTRDTVYVAEFYEVEDYKKQVDTWQHPVSEELKKVDAEDYDKDPELRQSLEDTGWQLIKSRKIKEERVHKYIMDGSEILEDCGYIAGENIPIVVVYGKRWFVDGIERFMGHVRLAKDAQRLKNVQLSQLAFMSATSPIETPILYPEQIAGNEDGWEKLHQTNAPFVTVNPIRDEAGNIVTAGPIGYTKPPTLSPAMAALLQITEQDMSDILGGQQKGEEMQANQSGKAVELIQQRLDMQAFIYLSNMAKAIKRTGEIWLCMAKEVYVEQGRKLKGITAQNAVEAIEIGKPVLVDGKAELENDLSRAELDVAVDVGPSSATKKQATVRALTNIAAITTDEAEKKVLLAYAIMNMEGEGLSDLAEYKRKQLVGLGVIDPTEEDKKRLAEEQQNQKPDANEQFLIASAEKEAMLAKKAGADTVLTLNKAAESEAKTLQTLQTVDMATAQAAQAQLNPPAVGESGPAPVQAEQGSMNANQTTVPPAIA